MVATARLETRRRAVEAGVRAAPSRAAALDDALAAVQLLVERTPASVRRPCVDLVLEFGVYQGASLRRVAGVLRQLRADKMIAAGINPRLCSLEVHAFDGWRGLPEDWVQTPLAVQKVGEYGMGGVVPTAGLPPGTVPHAGWFNETVAVFAADVLQQQNEKDVRLAFVSVDCDLYSSTLDALRPLAEVGLLRPGLVLHFDEYWGYPGREGHEAKAWDEVSAEFGLRYALLHWHGQRVAIRILGP